MGQITGNTAAHGQLQFIPWDEITPFCAAVVLAAEESLATALIANEAMTGRDGHRTCALPGHRLAGILSHAHQECTNHLPFLISFFRTTVLVPLRHPCVSILSK